MQTIAALQADIAALTDELRQAGESRDVALVVAALLQEYAATARCAA